MFRPFMRAPISISPPDHESIPPTSAILRLPPPLLNLIFDELTILDRCILALTSRSLLTFASSNEHLDYLISAPPTVYHLEHFFQRLSRGWIPCNLLRYCPDCGKFMSSDPHHWRHISEKHTRESVGRIAEIWRSRREDGWLRYWIERWCLYADSNEPGGSSVAPAALMFADNTEMVCPRCAVVNPGANEFRLGRIRERNERYGEARGRRVVSPGINSPSVGGGAGGSGGGRSVSGGSGSGLGSGGSEARVRSPLLERRQVAVAVRGGRMVQTQAREELQAKGRGEARHGLGIQTTWI